jgi:hypothetical protein
MATDSRFVPPVYQVVRFAFPLSYMNQLDEEALEVLFAALLRENEATTCGQAISNNMNRASSDEVMPGTPFHTRIAGHDESSPPLF